MPDQGEPMKWRIIVMAITLGMLFAVSFATDASETRPAIIDQFSGTDRLLVLFGLICLMALALVAWGWGIGQIKRAAPPIRRVQRPRVTYAAVSPVDEQVLRETAHLVVNQPNKERWN